MSRIEFDTSDDAMYCEPSDVARYFEQYEGFDSSSNPTVGDVKDHIKEWMSYIDRQTDHAWRTNTVVDEIKDPDTAYRWWSGRAYNLRHRHVRKPDGAEGDLIEEFGGDGWNDWLSDSSREYGRNADYWIDKSSGILWIHQLHWFRRHPRFRLKYRYGNPNGATHQIQMATAKLVAADLLHSDQYSMSVPGSEGGIGSERAAEKWREDAEKVIQDRKEVSYVDAY